MSEEFINLLKNFDRAIEKRQSGKFGKEDVKNIYNSATKVFDGEKQLGSHQIDQICEKWVALAEGKIDKPHALKKLKGTSRAEAIQSVLLSTVQQ